MELYLIYSDHGDPQCLCTVNGPTVPGTTIQIHYIKDGDAPSMKFSSTDVIWDHDTVERLRASCFAGALLELGWF